MIGIDRVTRAERVGGPPRVTKPCHGCGYAVDIAEAPFVELAYFHGVDCKRIAAERRERWADMLERVAALLFAILSTFAGVLALLVVLRMLGLVGPV